MVVVSILSVVVVNEYVLPVSALRLNHRSGFRQDSRVQLRCFIDLIMNSFAAARVFQSQNMTIRDFAYIQSFKEIFAIISATVNLCFAKKISTPRNIYRRRGAARYTCAAHRKKEL